MPNGGSVRWLVQSKKLAQSVVGKVFQKQPLPIEAVGRRCSGLIGT